MGAHDEHHIHDNSRESFDNLDTAGRDALVLAAYTAIGQPCTDREVNVYLGFGKDMNKTRPSITRLIDAGRLRQVGDTKCQVTKCKVRTCEPTKAGGAPVKAVRNRYKLPPELHGAVLRAAAKTRTTPERLVAVAVNAWVASLATREAQERALSEE